MCTKLKLLCDEKRSSVLCSPEMETTVSVRKHKRSAANWKNEKTPVYYNLQGSCIKAW